jgi:flagellar hook-associated protein 2
MAAITSSVGLISGINTGAIVDQLIAIEQQPVTNLEARIATNDAVQSAYNGFSTQLGSLQSIGQALELPTTFAATTATSSNTGALTATTSTGAAVGSYQFQVAQLVSSQQSISNGFASSSALAGAGNLTITLGGGGLASQTTLAQLNGGAGVPQGQFRITDRSGNTAVIDASSAVTLDDVVQQINTADNINVHASIQGNQLVLTDESGGTGNLSVQDVGDSTTADALGITGSVASNTLTGTDINTISGNTSLALLNDGRGVGTNGGAADFAVTLGDGSVVDVSLGAATNLGDVVKAINTAGGSKLSASLDTANNSIVLTDNSGGAGTLSLAALNGSEAAQDLGLTGAASGHTLQGKTVLASLDSTLVSSLHGGSGVPLGNITITDRNNVTSTVDLAGAGSVQDIINDINTATGGNVTASLNAAGNGIQLTDNSGGTGSLIVGDVNSTTAASLGLAGTFNSNTVNGGDLHTQFISDSTLLSAYNGGAGVPAGSFTITAASGATATIDTTTGTFNTVGDIISAINAKGIGVKASINADGNGILLTDNSTGSGHLKVADLNGGSTATDLQIAGTATANTIDGSLQKTIAVSSTDTIADVQQKIATLGFGVSANLIDDGSDSNPEHLSFTAFNSGTNGKFVIDGGTTNIATQTLVQAQNAAVFYGGSGNGANPLLITSDSNQITNVIPGVTLTLTGVSSSPVTLSVARDTTGIVNKLQNFTTTFNAIVTQLNTDTAFDASTNQAGLLLGDSTAQEIQSELYVALESAVQGAGQYHTLADIGFSFGNDGAISFDSSAFQSAYAADPTAAENLFTQQNTGIGALIDSSMTKLVDPVSGVITLSNSTLTDQNDNFQTSITELNALIANKKSQLEEQFANMEQVLAGLQSQQSALSSLSGVSSSSSSSKSSSSSSS